MTVADFIRTLPSDPSEALEQVRGALRFGTIPEDPGRLSSDDVQALRTEEYRLRMATERRR